MKQLTIIMLLSLSVACSPPGSTQEASSDKDSTLQEVVTQQPELEEVNLSLIDSSAYDWADGYILLDWSALAQVEFEYAYSEVAGQEVPFPIFSEALKVLDRRNVQVSGYSIPMEETESKTFVILSAFPYSQCFFCGQAGPESVIDILAHKKLPRLSTDDKTTFRGRLRLNDDDLRYLNYILDDAELVD